MMNLDLSFVRTTTKVLWTKIEQVRQSENGATAIEYAMIAAATGLALIAALPALETAVGSTFGLFATWLTT